jgi:hypothetical protein
MLEDGGGESESDEQHEADMQNICADAQSISSSSSDVVAYVVDDDPRRESPVLRNHLVCCLIQS